MMLCFVLGIGLRAAGRLPADAHKTSNAFIVNVALPALILRYVHDIHYEASLIIQAAMPWVMFGCATLFFSADGRATGWSRNTTGGLILAGGPARLACSTDIDLS